MALVISVNNYPAFWTVTCPNSTWAQYDCPLGMRGNIYKHHMKVFELFYCIVEETENIMGDSPMKEIFKEKKQRKLTMTRRRHKFW